ncbi:alkaline phosphatase D family protein [Haladaptatus caseinilyticus]|uniref:alkaline phosphatase D family protein n=1 Tax=Haladaptatus caseinilyticus TaxID=2993314 RepID=UPI00224B8B49|nr:alkaline phosphatase D family protein [Haladaptatus caseinilyticus]
MSLDRSKNKKNEQNDKFLSAKRREFLRTATGVAGLTTFGSVGFATGEDDDGARFSDNPFTLGVASGDPLPDSVVLWTRLALDPLKADGGMPDREIPVQWEIVTEGDDEDDDDDSETERGNENDSDDDEDEQNEDEDEQDENEREDSRVVRSGTAYARPEHAHSVHVEVEELEPNTEYIYQFTVGSYRSPVGRTKTTPTVDSDVDELRFVFASCQNYPYGYYTAHQHLATEDLDVVFHLGDYIYEGGSQGSLDRGHEPPREIESLADYRIRHAQYKSDSNLQDAHASSPWIITWDDHEVANNYADEIDEGTPPEEFLERRADAYQAYWEHQPIRRSRMPDGPDMPLYRQFTFGELAEFNVLDTRQYRDDQTRSSEKAKNPDRTILGDEQEQWLVDELKNSKSQWNVLAQQVPFAATDNDASPENVDFGGGDKWDGYRADRKTLLDVMSDDDDLNPVVITGDVHRNYAYDLKADFSNPDSETVGTEYVGTSISSFGDTSGLTQYGSSASEPWQRFFNVERGYVRCTLSEEEWRTDYRAVSTVEEPTASVRTVASFVTEAGSPGAELISERPDQEPLEITEIRPNQDGDLNNEYARVQNTGNDALDMSGFILSFEGGRAQNYTFENVTLGAGETVTVRNGQGEDTESTLYAGFNGAVLNNSNPDTVVVANDEGIILDEASYQPT